MGLELEQKIHPIHNEQNLACQPGKEWNVNKLTTLVPRETFSTALSALSLFASLNDAWKAVCKMSVVKCEEEIYCVPATGDS